MRLATEAAALADELGVEVALAHTLLGSTFVMLWRDGWKEHFRVALDAARAAGDVDLELTVANSFTTGLTLDADWAGAQTVADEVVPRARELGLIGWELSARGALMVEWVHWLGRLEDAVIEAEHLLRQPLFGRTRDQLLGTLGVALACLGRHDESADVFEREGARALDPTALMFRESFRAEAAWLGGRFDLAEAAADRCLALERPDFPLSPLSAMAKAWVAWETAAAEGSTATSAIDLGPGPGAPRYPLLAATTIDFAGLTALAAGDGATAADHFDRAAAAWEGRILLCELRSRWAAGEAARRHGDERGARDRLLAAEDRAEAVGLVGILPRVHRSLRLVGVRRSQRSDRQGRELSPREREVLGLVGDGHSSAAIARRLGLSPRTVDAFVTSAMTKLGAATRIEAAARAAGDGA